jgi:hypothetical protein
MRVVGMHLGPTGRVKNSRARCCNRCQVPGPRSHYGRNYRSQLIAATKSAYSQNDFHAGMLAFLQIERSDPEMQYITYTAFEKSH